MAIEPFKGGGSSEAIGAVGAAAAGVAGLLGSLGAGVVRHRRATNQRVHEANMQQMAHENNLEMIDHVTNAGKTLDTHKQELRERDRLHALDAVANYASNPNARVMGGRNLTVQETAEGGRTISHSIAAAPRKKAAPKAKKPAVPTTTTPIKTASEKPKAAKKTTSTGTEIINIGGIKPAQASED